MYEDFYGFVQAPFSLTPDPRFLYRSESHDLALQQVWQAIRRKEGFLVLTGDIGTGKTTLCRTLLEQFDPTTFTALVLNPFLSVEELLRDVLLSFGLVSKETVRTGRLATATKHELVRTLHDFLLSLVPLHGSAVLIIDEAQHLSTDVLEELRVLSNLETNDQKLLQIVIVGQLNLIDVLHKAELRQLDQRISIRCSLKPLTREEVEAYVTHRLWVARGSTPVSFTPKAFDLVHELSGGVPRMINLICDRALMVGCEQKVTRITEAHIVSAAAKLEIDVPRDKIQGESSPPDDFPAAPKSNRSKLVAAGAGALAVVAALALWFVGNPFELTQAPTSVPAPSRPARTAPLVLPATVDAPIPSVPAPIPGSYAIVIGTYNDVKQAQEAMTQLRAQKLEPYYVDLDMAPNDIRRRILIGRFTTREDANAQLATLRSSFPQALVIPSIRERNKYQLTDEDF